MLEFHPDFETPDSSTTVWRYMSLERFISLVTTSTLWFSRCDTFKDGWEGHYTIAARKLFEQQFVGDDGKIAAFFNNQVGINEKVRMTTYLSCWNINEEESAALWQIYSKAIAIRTTIHHLRDSLLKEQNSVFGGKVKYLDYHTESFPILGNLLNPFTRKRRSFSFENEFRLVRWTPEHLRIDNEMPETPQGVAVQIDLHPLLRNVFISPECDDYMVNAVKAILEKFEITCRVEKSDFFHGPI